MKKFTKLLTLFLSLAMIFSFASCNNGTTSPSDDTVPPTDDTTPPTDDKKPSEDTNTPPSDDKTPSTDTGSGDTEKEEKEEDTTLSPGKNVICQLKNSTHEQMMGYVFKTSDGKIIAIDGGTTGDADNLLATLKKMSGKDVPHVDAWILTHSHSDHINAFVELMKNHFDEFTVDKIYYNFPDAEFINKNESGNLATFNAFEAVKSKFEDKLVVSEVGDKYTIGAAKIDIMFVFDETITFNPINNASIIFRLTAGGKRMMFLGDAYIQAGNTLIDSYGVKVFADYCQMAHHGQAGVNKDVYELINPSICFWDAPDWLWDNDNGNGFNTGPYGTVTTRGWMDSIGVKTHYVQKDGNHFIDFATGLPITE